MKKTTFFVTLVVILIVAFGCGRRSDNDPDFGHSDNARRDLMPAEMRVQIGRGVTYDSAKLDSDALSADMGARRKHGWAIFQQINRPIVFGKEKVPAWQTWYDAEETSALVKKLFAELAPAERKAQAPFSEARIQAAMTPAGRTNPPQWNSAKFEAALQGEKSLTPASHGPAGTGFTLFSPEFVMHYLRNYRTVSRCSEVYLSNFPAEAAPPSPKNFAPCFDSEFPEQAVMLKTVWVLNEKPLQIFKSEGNDIVAALRNNRWNAASSVYASALNENQIFTMQSTGQKRFRLAAMHAVTKETRNWVWSTYWWSASPGTDFGADRPASLTQSSPALGNYKMCIVSDFEEKDPKPYAHFASAQPSLAKTLTAISGVMGRATWCANPYLEGSFPRTNCIGCHQHAPVAFETETVRRRNISRRLRDVVSEVSLRDRSGSAFRPLIQIDFIDDRRQAFLLPNCVRHLQLGSLK